MHSTKSCIHLKRIFVTQTQSQWAMGGGGCDILRADNAAHSQNGRLTVILEREGKRAQLGGYGSETDETDESAKTKTKA